MPAWSYTALTGYETCPRRYFLTRVSKEVQEPKGAALVEGTVAHKALEERARDGKPIPNTLTATLDDGSSLSISTQGWEAMMERILKAPGDVVVERQIALDSRLCEVPWFDKKAWVRGVIDLGLINGTKAVLMDHKTGKRKPDSDQLMLFAALAMHVWPRLEKVLTGFLWLKSKQIDQEQYTRGDLSHIWDHFVPRIRRWEEAHRTGTWEPRPSGLCKQWCPCVTCEFNGRRG